VTPSPSPQHQHVVATLMLAMRPFVERHRLGVVLYDVDLLFRSGQFLRPDLVFVPVARRDGITDRGVEVAPELVVEVVSPTSSAIDRVKKPRRYGEFGVPEYWAADPRERSIDVWRFAAGAADPERVTGSLSWRPAGATAPLVLDTADIFAPF
jgi:Uma2 family endonuclease